MSARPMRGLAALRGLVNPPAPEAEPAAQLLEVAKTLRGPDPEAGQDRDVERLLDDPRVLGALISKIEKTQRDYTAIRALESILEPNLVTLVSKQRREEPPGLHHTSGPRTCTGCRFYKQRCCTRYDWQVDRDEVCSAWEPRLR